MVWLILRYLINMKRWLLIIGIIITLLLAGIWVYLLMGGSVEDGDKFSLFQFSDTTDTTVPENEYVPPAPEEPVVDVIDQSPLRQLTTKPVVGYKEIQLTASSSPLVYYVEAGTGHLYSIDLTTGVEERISNITVPAARDALISSDGQYAVLQTNSHQGGELTVVTLPTSSSSKLASLTLSEKVVDYSITGDNQLLYAVHTTNGALTKSFDLEKKTTEILFEIPFREVLIDWGNEITGPHYFYPKPSSQLQGALYKVVNNNISRVPISGFGLTAKGNSEFIVFSNPTSNLGFNIYNISSGEVDSYEQFILSDKCVLHDLTVNFGVCARPLEQHDSRTLLEKWYRGEVTTSDELVFVTLDEGYIHTAVNIEAESGRSVDVQHLVLNKNGTSVLFTNKPDDQLWIYDYSELVSAEQ